MHQIVNRHSARCVSRVVLQPARRRVIVKPLPRDITPIQVELPRSCLVVQASPPISQDRHNVLNVLQGGLRQGPVRQSALRATMGRSRQRVPPNVTSAFLVRMPRQQHQLASSAPKADIKGMLDRLHVICALLAIPHPRTAHQGPCASNAAQAPFRLWQDRAASCVMLAISKRNMAKLRVWLAQLAGTTQQMVPRSAPDVVLLGSLMSVAQQYVHIALLAGMEQNWA